MVEVSEPPTVPDCCDPKDRPFLELALFAQADALVTGDADLLALTSLFSIPIITATALQRASGWRKLSSRQETWENTVVNPHGTLPI